MVGSNELLDKKLVISDYALVSIPNSNKLLVIHIEDIAITTYLKLQNVFCVSGSLIIYCMLKRSQKLKLRGFFFPSCFYIFQDLKTWRLIGVGRLKNRVYQCSFNNGSGVAHPTLSIKDASLWHQCLDHVFFSHLKQIPLLNNVILKILSVTCVISPIKLVCVFLIVQIKV